MEDIKRVSVRPGDKFVVSCPGPITNEMAARLSGKLSNELNADVIVLGDGLMLSTLSPVPDMVQDIADFHKKFGLEYAGKPRFLDEALQSFRTKFMEEELSEYRVAVMLGLETIEQVSMFKESEIINHLEKALDALVDLVYVALGTAHMHGFDFNEAWRRVHEANMKKIRAERKEQSARGSTFDVIKPPGWKPPSHRDLVSDNIHTE